MTIRPETISDYAAIAAVHARAFGSRAAEAAIVALLRQRPDFDPALSLVAEAEGRVVGHALFTPYTVRLLGQAVRAVNLAPLAVDPDYQRQGWGTRLMQAGHAAAAARGYAFCLLLGHAAYYPRLGYATHAYGTASLRLPASELPAPRVTVRPVAAADPPALRALWERAEGDVDFALDPGEALQEWVSPNPAVACLVFEAGGRVVGYARVEHSRPLQPRAVLAADADAARQVAAALLARAAAEGVTGSKVVLPLHPRSAGAQGSVPAAEAVAWEAGMARPLGQSPLARYLDDVQAGRRPPGRVVWPVAFDLD